MVLILYVFKFETRFRAKMAKTAPKEVLVKKKIKDGLTKERMLQIIITDPSFTFRLAERDSGLQSDI